MFNFLIGVKLNKKINKKLKLVKNTQNVWPQLDMDVHNKTVQLTLQIKLENSYFNYKKKTELFPLWFILLLMFHTWQPWIVWCLIKKLSDKIK